MADDGTTDGAPTPGSTPGVVTPRTLNCPNCGAAVAVRTFGHAVNVVCQSCRTILDAQNPGVQILQKAKDATKYEPLIPLGTRGTIRNVVFEVVGFQVRQVTVDSVDYRWREYLLFNPYQGFRYITEYAGHWNVVSTLRSLPAGDATPASTSPHGYDGRTFRHFQTAVATTVFVLGEFPWQTRVGEQATVSDYVNPPFMLSGEMTADKEVTWSLSEYTSGADLWRGLALPGEPPPPQGVFADQPSPLDATRSRMWRDASLLVAVATLLWLVHVVTARRVQAYTERFVFDPKVADDAAIVTPVFDLDGRASAVGVDTVADTLDNQWIFLGYSLINDDTGEAYDFGREVSFYGGFEDGEAWTEGSRNDSVTLPQIPAGRYFLRIEPETEPGSVKPIPYRVTVVRDVPTSSWYFSALVLLAFPPILVSWRVAGFERRRWAESDHAD